MFHEIIWSTPMWKAGEIPAPRRDCVYIAKHNSRLQDGLQGLFVAHVYLFFSFQLDNLTYPCALVHLFKPLRDEPDPDTGMWIFQPDCDQDGY